MKILPPTLLIISMGLMVFLHFLMPLKVVVGFPATLGGMLMIATGLFLSMTCSRQFEKTHTTVMTFDEPQYLVTNGIYRYSRNPMYLGLGLLILGLGVVLGSLSCLGVSAGYIIFTDLYYIRYEERELSKKFGPAYEAYKKRVRRWL